MLGMIPMMCDVATTLFVAMFFLSEQHCESVACTQ